MFARRRASGVAKKSAFDQKHGSDCCRISRSRQSASMLREKEHLARIELLQHFGSAPRRRGRAVMNSRARRAANQPAFLFEPQAKVFILGVHEEPLVEQSDLVERLAP